MVTPPPSPWVRPWFLIAAGIVVLIAAAGVVVALDPGEDNPGPHTGPSTPPSTSTTLPGQPPAPLPTAIPTTAPEVRWELVGQTAVPVSATAGPARVADGIATGYAHTPVGALVAAAQISTRAGYSAGRNSWEPTIERQFVPGPDRDRLLTALRSVGDSPAGPGDLSQIAGYQYLSYTPESAVIGLVYRAPSSGTSRYHVLTLTMVWRDGDWWMTPPPGGAWTSVNRPATDLTGVVEWGAR